MIDPKLDSWNTCNQLRPQTWYPNFEPACHLAWFKGVVASSGWLRKLHKGIHYPELLVVPSRECEMRCTASKAKALASKLQEVQLVKSMICL